ncbi:GP158 protein, partial [Campylorhamphus procurvoides]|nr:GP158 protein [Campylorhamphus procurvoides]
CWPCRPGCATCEDDKPCLIQEDQVLRAAVLSCQACCMLAIFLSMLVSYHFRRSKARIRASGIILLETILFGSLLLYFPVFILYFKPSIFRCIVLRWVRMLGFATVYGTITLKLYRIPTVGKAQCSEPTQWGALDAQDPHSGRVWVLRTPAVGGFGCSGAPQWGDLAAQDPCEHTESSRVTGLGAQHRSLLSPTAEMLFLLWGSFLCYATRAVPSAFHEPRYMGIALHNELMISAAFHVVRASGSWGPLALWGPLSDCPLVSPQFLHTGSPLREEITAEVYEDELDMRRSGSCMNSSIASAWSEHSLDPDDIREELKKLYRQLEVHKTWRMVANNPHLGRRRSSRRSLARSILRR